MRRFLVFVCCLSGLILRQTPVQAQYTSQSRTASPQRTQTSATVPAENSSVRFTRSAAETQTRQTGSFTTNRSQNVTATPNAQSSAVVPSNRLKKTASRSSTTDDEDLDMPDFNVAVSKKTQGMSQAQKMILLEEFARKKQEEKEARIQAENDRKAAIAKKIAEEKPKPGMVFDENGIERPIPKGEVWVYSSEFEQGDLRGRMHCSWKVVLQNRTNAKLESLNLGLFWPSYAADMAFSNVAPNATKVEEMFMFSPNCPSLRTKPRLEPKNCTLGPMKNEECNKYVVLK